jgi:hypothetical protein
MCARSCLHLLHWLSNNDRLRSLSLHPQKGGSQRPAYSCLTRSLERPAARAITAQLKLRVAGLEERVTTANVSPGSSTSEPGPGSLESYEQRRQQKENADDPQPDLEREVQGLPPPPLS